MFILMWFAACSTVEVPEAPVPSEVAPAIEARAEAGPSSGALQDAIAIRGAWHLEVRDPDGSTVREVDFHNAFIDNDNALPQILAGKGSAGSWQILLGDLQGDNACILSAGVDSHCLIAEPGFDYVANPSLSTNLTVTVEDGAIVLAGSILASDDGSVSVVATRVGICADTVAPDACNAGGAAHDFTNHPLTGPDIITLVEGQQILATVRLTFATAP